MKKLLVIAALINSCLGSEVNLSPEYEEDIINAQPKRLMQMKAKKELNAHYQKLQKEYKKAIKDDTVEPADYIVSACDLDPSFSGDKQIVSFYPRYKISSGLTYEKFAILVYEDEIITEPSKNKRFIIFTKDSCEYRSCIWIKTENKKKKERDAKKKTKKKQ